MDKKNFGPIGILIDIFVFVIAFGLLFASFLFVLKTINRANHLPDSAYIAK